MQGCPQGSQKAVNSIDIVVLTSFEVNRRLLVNVSASIVNIAA